MSERMIPIPFAQLMNWLATELQREGTAFGVHRPYWAGEKKLPIFGEEYIETPLRPRRRSQYPAGPEYHRLLLRRGPVL